MKEIWKDVVGYEGLYQVSSLGRIKSLPNHRHKDSIILNQYVHNGYYIVRLAKNGCSKTRPVYRIVATAFIPNLSNLPQINHIDGNNFKTGDGCNNCVDNLEWCTNKENCNEAKHIENISGENNSNWGKCRTQEEKEKISKALKGRTFSEEHRKHISESRIGLSPSIEIRKKRSHEIKCVETQKIYYSLREAERQTGVGHSGIADCCRGKRKTAGGYHWEYVKDDEQD